MILRFVPLIKTGLKVFVVVSFFALVLALYLAHVKWGIIAIYAFSFTYAIGMLVFFFVLTRRFYLKLDFDNGQLIIRRPFKKTVVQVEDVTSVNMFETPQSYILTLETTNKKKDFSLSGSLSFEEPPFAPFLRKMYELKPTIGFNDFCINILHGTTEFKSWSSKMYASYWTYIGTMVVYYLLSLVFITLII